MRPVYQTHADQSRQCDIVARYLAWRAGVVKENLWYRKSADLDCDDGEFIDDAGRIAAIVEVKNRRNPMLRYSTFAISEKKLINCLAKAKLLKVDFVLLVQFTDALTSCHIKDLNFARSMEGARRDRGDALDQEVMFQIPVSRLQIRG